MRYDVINALGNKYINTPRINALINDGVAIRNCYVQNQLCTPSRARFLTGRYPAAHQVYRNGNAFFPKSEVLITKLLADNPQGSVVIQADEKAQADAIIQVMDQSREAGVYAISLASEPKF